MFFRPTTTTPRQRRRGQTSKDEHLAAYMVIWTLGGVLRAMWSR